MRILLFVFLWGTCLGQTVTLTPFSPNGGAVADGTFVSLTATPTDAIICVTRWDEYPVCNNAKTGCANGFLYKSGFLKKVLADEGSLWYAIACKAGQTDSSIVVTSNYWGSVDKPTPVLFSPIGAPQDQEITMRSSSANTNSYVICWAEDALPDCQSATECTAGTKYMDTAKPKVTANSIGTTWVAIVCTDQYTYSDYSYVTWGELATPFLIPSGGGYNDNIDVQFKFPPSYVAISNSYFCVGVDKVIPVCKRSDSTCSVGTKVDISPGTLKKQDIHNGKRWAVIACPPQNGNYTQSEITYTNTWDIATKVSLPVFFPDGGFVSTGVTIAAVPYDSTICYNTKGSPNPECATTKDACKVGDRYDPIARISPSVITEGAIYQAVACKASLTDSAVATHTNPFTKDSTVTFSPNGGVVSAGQEITMTTKLVGSAICYTTDDSYPTCDDTGTNCETGTLYNDASKPKIAESDYGDYWIAVPCKRPNDYSLSLLWNKLQPPVFDPLIGSVDNGKDISITATPTDSIICYIPDGAENDPDPVCPADLTATPTCLVGRQYNPNNKTKKTMDNTIWRAIACRKGSLPSDVALTTYWKESPTPRFTPNGGSLKDGSTVVIDAPGASPAIVICYMASDNPKPTSTYACSGANCPSGFTKYNPTSKATKNPSDNGKYWIAISCETGKEASIVAATKGAWNNQVLPPIFDPDGGPMLDKNRVSISSPTLMPYPNDGVICMCFNDCANGPKCKSDGKSCESGYTQYNEKNKPQFIKANHDQKKWKAIACKKDMLASSVTMTTNAWNQVPVPKIFPDGGTVNVNTPILIQSTDGATICYGRSASVGCSITNSKGTCTNGNNAADSRPVITQDDLGVNWYAISCKSGLKTSELKTTAFKWRTTNQIVSPNFVPNGGKTPDSTPIAISSEFSGAVICYSKTSDLPSCTSDNTGCAVGLRYDDSNRPLKTDADNGKRWSALVCDLKLGASKVTQTEPWEKYINGAISGGMSMGLLIFSLVSLIMIM